MSGTSKSKSALVALFCFCALHAADGIQEPKNSTSAVNDDERRVMTESLDLGKLVNRELQPGRTDRYSITLANHEFLHVAITAPDIELLVTVAGPNQEPLATLDTSDGPTGQRSIFLLAARPGSYVLELQAKQHTASSGHYELKILELRAAATSDQNTIEAFMYALRGDELRREAANESSQNAISEYEKARQLWSKAGRPRQQIQTLVSLAAVLSDLGENKRALEVLIEAVAVARSTSDQFGVAQALVDRASVYNALGDNEKALADLDQAFASMRAAHDLRCESNARKALGDVFESRDESTKALESFNQALLLRQQLGDRKLEAESLSDIGVVYYDLDDDRKALEYYDQALPLARAVGDKRGESHVLHDMGHAYQDLGEIQSAIELFTQSLAIKHAVGDRRAEANTLDGIGWSYFSMSEHQKALAYLNQALPLRRAVGDRAGEGITLGNLGSVYSILGDSERALGYYSQALALDRAVGSRFQEGIVLNNLGLLYFEIEDYHKALEYQTQALAVKKAISDRYGLGVSLNNAAKVYEATGDKPRAYSMLEEALGIFIGLNDRRWQAITLKNLGELQASLGKPQDAHISLQKALDLAIAVHDRRVEAATLYEIARVERDLGEMENASVHIETALDIVESTRAGINNPSLRASYFSTEQMPYELYIDLLMEMHKQHPLAGYDGKALEIAERAKARGLIEVLTESGADIRQGVDQQLLERDRSLQKLIAGKSTRYETVLNGKHTDLQAAVAKRELEETLAQYYEVEGEIRSKSPRYAALAQPSTLNIVEIQQLLDSDTLLLEYFLGKLRSYLWAVTPSSVRAFVLPGKLQIEAVAQRTYNQTITNKIRGGSAFELSEMLLMPVANELGKKRLLIVGSGSLQYVPFSALPIPNVAGPSSAVEIPLVTVHEIVTVPSASIVALLRKENDRRAPAPKTLVVLADPVYEKDDPRVRKLNESRAGNSSIANAHKGDPLPSSDIRDCEPVLERLPFSRREGDAILALVPPAQAMHAYDFDANLNVAMGPLLSQYRYVHIASHGCINLKHPELSAVVLSMVNAQGNSQDGFLRLHEIYNLHLHADLVVLSACQTGLGRSVAGEGLVDLTRGFMYAGAEHVAVSLWNISDEATAELMKIFYQQMLVRHLRPAAALRAAQIAMWKQPKWRSPYYWGAFILQGDWL